jgi:hypothetical protein
MSPSFYNEYRIPRKRVRVMVFITTFNHISLYRAGQIYWWRKLDYWGKPPTYHKSLANFNTIAILGQTESITEIL